MSDDEWVLLSARREKAEDDEFVDAGAMLSPRSYPQQHLGPVEEHLKSAQPQKPPSDVVLGIGTPSPQAVEGRNNIGQGECFPQSPTTTRTPSQNIRGVGSPRRGMPIRGLSALGSFLESGSELDLTGLGTLHGVSSKSSVDLSVMTSPAKQGVAGPSASLPHEEEKEEQFGTVEFAKGDTATEAVQDRSCPAQETMDTNSLSAEGLPGLNGDRTRQPLVAQVAACAASIIVILTTSHESSVCTTLGSALTAWILVGGAYSCLCEDGPPAAWKGPPVCIEAVAPTLDATLHWVGGSGKGEECDLPSVVPKELRAELWKIHPAARLIVFILILEIVKDFAPVKVWGTPITNTSSIIRYGSLCATLWSLSTTYFRNAQMETTRGG